MPLLLVGRGAESAQANNALPKPSASDIPAVKLVPQAAPAQKEEAPSAHVRMSGKWQTPPGASVQATMTFGKGWADDELTIGQQWVFDKKSLAASRVRYTVVHEGNHGTLAAPGKMEYTPDLEKMSFELESDTLTIVFEKGRLVGRHSLRRVSNGVIRQE